MNSLVQIVDVIVLNSYSQAFFINPVLCEIIYSTCIEIRLVRILTKTLWDMSSRRINNPITRSYQPNARCPFNKHATNVDFLAVSRPAGFPDHPHRGSIP